MSEMTEQEALAKAANIILYGYVENRDATETARKVRELAFPETAAKSEPVTIDRDALIERMAEASAVSRYNYVNFGKRWDDLSGTEQEEWMQQERRRMTTLVDDVVIAHLAARPRSFTNDEIHDAGMDARHAVDWRSYGLGGDDEAAQDISHAITERAVQSLAAQPVTGTVEIGGQVMTQAQFDAARFPLLNLEPGEVT